MITINPNAADVITINISDSDQITLNTTAILLEDRDVDTLQGENGAYYLDRDNHTGTQAANTITGLATVATSGSYNDLSNKPTISLDPASLSDAGAALPTDQLVIYRNGVPMRTTVAQLGLAPTPPSVDLLLMPTGATESADGEYQRFVWDGVTLNLDNQGIWEASLPSEDRGDAYRIQMKMPVVVVDDSFVTVRIGDAPSYMATVDNSDGNRVIFEAFHVADNSAAELHLYGMSVLEGVQTYTTNVAAPAPAAGTVITLDVTQTTAVMSWGSESYPLTITSGLLPALSDVLAYSSGFEPPPPLSIKVLRTE